MTVNGLLSNLSKQPVRTRQNNLLEHAAELEEPCAVAGVAQAAADKERAQGRFRQKSCGNIVGEIGAGGYAVHFSDLVGSDGVDFFSEKRRKSKHVTQKSPAK